MDPELLQQLQAAGMTEEQLRLLGPRLQLGQQMMQPQEAAGRQVGGTYVAASPFEHLANAMRQIVGAKISSGAMQKQQDLLAQQRQGRQNVLQALTTAQSGGQAGPGPGTPYQQFDTPLDQQGTGQNMAGRPPDPQAAQALMTAMAGSGDQALHGAAQFGLQQQNLQREQSMLQNTLLHQRNTERMEQEKIDQGRYTPIKNMFGEVTGLLEGKTGKILPLSTAASAPKPGLTPEALAMMAKMGAATGTIPTVGRGNAATATAMQIANQMAGGGGAAPDLASNKATNKADTGSLATQQKILDNAEGWERTGKANLNVLLGIAQKLQDTGSPWLNSPVRTFMEKGVGDPNMTAFKAAHATVVNEYAKILSGAQGSGAVTEGARHEAESMLPLNATWEQLAAAAKVLDTDAGNRISAARQQVANIKGRISGQAPAQSAEVTPPPPQKATHRFNAATGKIEAIP